MAIRRGNTLIHLPSSGTPPYTHDEIIAWYKEVPFKRRNLTTRPYTRIMYDYSRETNPEKDYLYGSSSSFTLFMAQGMVGYSDYPLGKRYRELLMNKLHAKLRDKALNSASMGETLAEGREALGMVANRLTQIGKAAMLVRRGQFSLAARTLDITLSAQKVRRMHRLSRGWEPYQKLSAWWLEYWLGWAPLIGDIYNAMNVLSQEFPEIRHKVGSTMIVEHTYQDGNVDTGSKHVTSGRLFGSAWATVQVTNPNTLLLNQMGLINPFAVAWALVPFSFVVDWFVNVSNKLNSFTDWCGVQLKDPGYTLYFQADSNTRQEHWRFMLQAIWNPAVHQQWSKGDVKCFAMKRSVGVPGVTLNVLPFKGLSVTRAATAASLVVSIFSPRGVTYTRV